MDRLTALLNAPRALQRAIALLLLCAVVAICGGFVWLAAGSLTAEAEIIRMKRERLGNLQSIIALRQVVQDTGALDAQAVSGEEFLQGASEAVIRANLQSRLTTIAAAHGVKVLSVGNTPIRQRGNIRYAGLRADVSGTNEAIHATLFDIETSRPYLVIRNATIRSTLSSQATGKNGSPELVAQIQFYGALPPEGQTSGAGG